MRSAVVLPQPDGPSRATSSPGAMCRVEPVEGADASRRRGSGRCRLDGDGRAVGSSVVVTQVRFLLSVRAVAAERTSRIQQQHGGER